jgi:group I intron endonuclease
MPKKGYIYLIRNLVNGKGYVGKTEKTISLRFAQHKNESKLGSKYALHAAMRKYGISNFSVIEIASSEPYQLNDLEKHFIAKYGTFAPLGNGYNLTLGGEGQTGLVHSKETRLKLSAITKAQLAKNGHPMKGKKHSAESVAKMSESRRGQPSAKKGKKCGPLSDEHKRKISDGNKGKVFSIERRTRISESQKGKNYSEETIQRLRDSHTGKIASNETKAKMSASRKGRKRAPFSDEWKANISAGKRKKAS